MKFALRVCIVHLMAANGAAYGQFIVDHPPHPAGGPASDTDFINMFGQPSWQLLADDFQVSVPATARRLVWFGFYDQDNPPVLEAMRIRVYGARLGDGLPGAILYEELVSNHTRTATGRRIGVGISPHEYRYELNLAAPVSFSPSTPYWLEIAQLDDLATAWRWEYSIQDLNGHAFMNLNFPDWRSTGAGDGDLAFRLIVPEPGTLSLVCIAILRLGVIRRV